MIYKASRICSRRNMERDILLNISQTDMGMQYRFGNCLYIILIDGIKGEHVLGVLLRLCKWRNLIYTGIHPTIAAIFDGTRLPVNTIAIYGMLYTRQSNVRGQKFGWWFALFGCIHLANKCGCVITFALFVK